MKAHFLFNEIEFERDLEKLKNATSEKVEIRITLINNGNTSKINNEELMKKIVDRLQGEI